MPGVDELKADISVHQKRFETLRDEVKALTDVTDNNRKKLKDDGELINRVEDLSRAENSLSNQPGIDRTAVEKIKQDLETRLNDGGFDEENPEAASCISRKRGGFEQKVR
ncbi:hypothetical protein R1sor_018093 [Riccia sorocarpa]|uniref:Uncharacterized protein n=1 Tax=Riccia sorocarpa TaxID=122646 RepID=A0ABD3I949_9MARC